MTVGLARRRRRSSGLGQQLSVSQQFSNFLIVGITIVKLPGIGSKPKVYVTGSNSTIESRRT